MERAAPTLFLPCEDKALAFICAPFGLHFNLPLPKRRKFEAKGHLARPCQKTDDRMAMHGLIWLSPDTCLPASNFFCGLHGQAGWEEVECSGEAAWECWCHKVIKKVVLRKQGLTTGPV